MSRWANKIKWTLIITSCFLVVAYLYLLNSSVFAVAERRDNREEISQLEAEVSTLEALYVDQLSGINLALAEELGFVEATGQAVFVVRTRPLGYLTVNNEN